MSVLPTLSERIADLKRDLPQIAAEAAKGNWLRGISARLAWAVKRIERWEAGDERPVQVLIFPDRRVLARVVQSGEDGAEIEIQRAGGSP